MMDRADLPPLPAVACVDVSATRRFALWTGQDLLDLTESEDSRLRSLDSLLALSLSEIRSLLETRSAGNTPVIDPMEATLCAPVQSQEVWGAGVTYLRSREARMEEAISKDIYAQVYVAKRPELFFKAAGWRVVAPGGKVAVRSDSTWDVPEPELAVLSNAHGQVVAYTCGNDMSSRSIEGENPLYLPQAKVYDASCALGPVAVLAWNVDPRGSGIQMSIDRAGVCMFSGTALVRELVREPADLVQALWSAYSLPAGVWLMTGTSIVPPLPYTAEPGDVVRIAIDQIGELCNEVQRIEVGEATIPRVDGEEAIQ